MGDELTREDVKIYFKHFRNLTNIRKNGITVCVGITADDKIYAGVSACSLLDNFSKKRGRQIAQDRMFKLIENEGYNNSFVGLRNYRVEPLGRIASRLATTIACELPMKEGVEKWEYNWFVGDHTYKTVMDKGSVEFIVKDPTSGSEALVLSPV